ncbi:META domain-containing protein [Hymenobacter fodinae]|uniref:META domain-containing protein n=1 Tax=Hymenobacter fodinae TaxID=2510796 RepID=A0A4Z0PDU8_9BACT|nr:META domain-containing protein [Hymenobacter fodinae]TGE09829.1 META domain-containing protein [Hymenobacter fodinae]
MNRLFVFPSVLLSLGLTLGSCSQKATEATGTVPPAVAMTTVAADPTQLNGRWQITTLNGAAVPAGEPERAAHLIFDSATGRLSGSTSCNRLMGSYTATGNTLTFNQVASTRMACVGPNVEQQVMTMLNTPGLTYQLSADNQLTLLSGSTPVAVLIRATP